MALKEEIFKQDSTLFRVLDENEITELGSLSKEVDQLAIQIDQNKTQIDALGKVVDNNQSRNEQQFVIINTQLVNDRTDIGKLQDEQSQLKEEVTKVETAIAELEGNVENRFTDVYTKLNANTQSISDMKSDISKNTQSISTVNQDVTTNRRDIRQLEINLNNTDASLSSLTTRVEKLENGIKAQGADGLIYGGTVYKIRFISNQSAGTIATTDITFQTELVECGYKYTCRTITTSYNGELKFEKPTGIMNMSNYIDIPVQLGTQYLASGSLVFATGSGGIVYTAKLNSSPVVVYYKRDKSFGVTNKIRVGNDDTTIQE